MIAETRSDIFRWRSRFRRRRGCLSSLVTGTATATPQTKNLIGRASENKRAARAARIYEQVRAILCKTTTWNYLIYSFDNNPSHSLYLI